MRILSKVLSVILHPVFMPMAGVFLVFNSGTAATLTTMEYQRSIYIIVFICTVLLPMSIIPFFVFRKPVKNLPADTPRERLAPLLITFLFYYICYFLISRLTVPQLLEGFLLAIAVTVFLVLVITFFWKISIHTTGIGGIAGIIFFISERYRADMLVPLMLVIIAAGIVACARLQLQSHKPSQVYAGFGLGAFTVGLTMYFFFAL
ncbi:MAG: PAP2 family protein [Bacteroidetes bacterium]|nr:PAP2 family protein [Bacteroidota bacterium]